MDELRYRLPPDVLHYEPKYLFGLGIQDLLLAAMPAVFSMLLAGLLVGVITGVVLIGALKRWEGLGNRAAVVYFALWLWHKYRPATVILPRVLPRQETRLEVTAWDGAPLYTLEVEP
jgi:hypothetical protein